MTVRNIASICNMVSMRLAIGFPVNHCVWTRCVVMLPPPLYPDSIFRGEDHVQRNITVVPIGDCAFLPYLGAQIGIYTISIAECCSVTRWHDSLRICHRRLTGEWSRVQFFTACCDYIRLFRCIRRVAERPQTGYCQKPQCLCPLGAICNNES